MNIFDSVINNDFLKVNVILPSATGTSPTDTKNKRSVITGYLENPFSVNASAEWSDKLFGRDYSTTMNNILGKLGNDTQLYTILDTTQQYISANIPQFNISFYVIATNSSINPMSKVMDLYKAIYPEKNGDLSIKYHWGYTPNALGDANGNIKDLQGSTATTGTVILTIGKWFRAINMIIDDVKVDYSDTLAPNGRPLWVKPTISFKPRRLPYANEFIQMFIPNDIGG